MADDELMPAQPGQGGRKAVFASGLMPGEEPPAPPGPPPSDDEVTPEEQNQYDQLVARVGKFVWDGKKHQAKVLALLKHKDREFYMNVGSTAYQLVHTEVEKARRVGVKISEDVAFHAAADYVVPWLFELAEAAKLVSFEGEQQEQEQMGMALAETQRLHGEQVLQGPGGGEASREAQDYYASQVATEADAGQIAPGFKDKLQPMAAAVRNGMGATSGPGTAR